MAMALGGIYPPIPTAFNPDESLALDRFEQNLARWLEQPIDGVVMPGSNSESALLSAAEREALWQSCAAALRGTGKRLIAGTGAESTRETIRLTERAAELGAEAALLLPPYFFKAELTTERLVAHYRAVADAAPIPVLIYNVPAYTGVDLELGVFTALADHPQVAGTKDSSANVVKMARLLAIAPHFQVLSGSAGALLPFLSIGGVGGIMALANIAAVPLRRLMDAFAAGSLAEARRLQLGVAELNAAITARFGVPGLKYAMDQLGYYGGVPRRPLQPLGAAGRAEIDRLIEGTRALL